MAFEQAIKYFDAGIDLLGNDSWNTNYDLSLAVHNATAKVGVSTGKVHIVDNALLTFYFLIDRQHIA